jgi:hypothetical protein
MFYFIICISRNEKVTFESDDQSFEISDLVTNSNLYTAMIYSFKSMVIYDIIWYQD